MTATMDAPPDVAVFPPRAAVLVDPPEEFSAPTRVWRSKDLTRAASLAGEATLPPIRTWQPSTSWRQGSPPVITYYRSASVGRDVDGRLPEDWPGYSHRFREAMAEHEDTFDNGKRVLTFPCLLKPRMYGIDRREAADFCPHPQHRVEAGLHDPADEAALDKALAEVDAGLAHRTEMLDAAARTRSRVEEDFSVDEQRFRADLDARRTRDRESDTLRYWTGPTAGGVPVIGSADPDVAHWGRPAEPEHDIIGKIDDVLADHEAVLLIDTTRSTPRRSPRFMVNPLGEVVDLYELADEHNRAILARLDTVAQRPSLLRRACTRVRDSLAPVFFYGLAD